MLFFLVIGGRQYLQYFSACFTYVIQVFFLTFSFPTLRLAIIYSYFPGNSSLAVLIKFVLNKEKVYRESFYYLSNEESSDHSKLMFEFPLKSH